MEAFLVDTFTDELREISVFRLVWRIHAVG